MKMQKREEKNKTLIVKSILTNVTGTKIYINNDPTIEEKQIQKYIKKIEKREREIKEINQKWDKKANDK